METTTPEEEENLIKYYRQGRKRLQVPSGHYEEDNLVKKSLNWAGTLVERDNYGSTSLSQETHRLLGCVQLPSATDAGLQVTDVRGSGVRHPNFTDRLRNTAANVVRRGKAQILEVASPT